MKHLKPWESFTLTLFVRNLYSWGAISAIISPEQCTICICLYGYYHHFPNGVLCCFHLSVNIQQENLITPHSREVSLVRNMFYWSYLGHIRTLLQLWCKEWYKLKPWKEVFIASNVLLTHNHCHFLFSQALSDLF